MQTSSALPTSLEQAWLEWIDAAVDGIELQAAAQPSLTLGLKAAFESGAAATLDLLYRAGVHPEDLANEIEEMGLPHRHRRRS